VKAMTVGEFKARFSAVLDAVKQGETFEITYGKKRKIVAILRPPVSARHSRKRPLGLFKGKLKAQISKDWEISDEDLVGRE
jgi:antitoxin (DNA-binding transcriptional repressor) of toxin-antitoxin stability system